MPFEKINNIKVNNINDRSCIMIINFNKKEYTLIKSIGKFIGIRDYIILDDKNGNNTIRDILNDDISNDCESGIKSKAIVFNNIEYIKVNSFLESLKKMRINKPLSAVVTDTSINWTLDNLIMNLVEEHKAMISGKSINHK